MTVVADLQVCQSMISFPIPDWQSQRSATTMDASVELPHLILIYISSLATSLAASGIGPGFGQGFLRPPA
jgi:hypothetical protein